MLTPNKLTLFVLAALAAGALGGCEAGTVDAGTGRFVAAESSDKRAQDSQAEAPVKAKEKASEARRDGDDAAGADDRGGTDADDRGGTDADDATVSGEEPSAVAAYAQAEVDASGQAEPIPESFAHLGTSREFPDSSKDLVLPESVAAAAAAAAAAGAAPDPDHAPLIDSVSPSSAPSSGGSELQIHGKNLQAYRVVVGFAPARILSVTEAGGTVTLTVAAPPRTGPATVAVVVTNRDGSVAIASEPFQYLN